MLPRANSYDELRRAFRWDVPARCNIAVDCCDRHAEGGAADRVALIEPEAGGGARRWTFGMLRRQSNRLANVLQAHGVARGDRIGILLGQQVETALSHLAAYKLGAVALPLFGLFGEDALEYRLRDSGARAAVTNAANLPKLLAIRDRLPELRALIVTDGDTGGLPSFHETLERASDAFVPVDTAADDPALLIYTSGTTGPPKGALHGQRIVRGHLPGVEFPHEFFPQPGDLMWTPADWAWAGGLLDILLPALHHGVPVLASRTGKFDPEEAFALMAAHGVRNAFLPPTALKMMRQVPDPRSRHAHALRSIGSGGESLGADLLDWGREAFGLTINEFYGQTECNLVLASCAGLMPSKPGWIGRAVPGHVVAIVDADGNELPADTPGEIAVRRPDPVMFLEYWNNPEATAAKFAGDWLLTGDSGVRDAEGNFRFVGRGDDIITSSGYRIGPGEIEECLMRHPAVAMAAAVGIPDPVRTEIVKAFVVLREGQRPSATLEDEIRAFVRTRLAAHEYPRAIAFVDDLPMTATGKIRRRDLRDAEVAQQQAQQQ